MNMVCEEIRSMVEKESKREEKECRFYPSFYSKYGAMFDGLLGIRDASRNVNDAFDNMWRMFRLNDEDLAQKQSVEVSKCAEKLAVEAIKLAIVARKQIEEDFLPKGAEVSE